MRMGKLEDASKGWIGAVSGFGPGDASQAPPPERASPGPVAPMEASAEAEGQLALPRSGAHGQRPGLAPMRPCLALHRSERRGFCRYLSDGRPRMEGRMARREVVILPRRVAAVKGPSD